jgi:ParB family transcriptional regulator, chromosome partitioning protein
MPKASRDALGAKGKTDVYYFDPADVVLVEDKGSALYDERVANDFSESLVVNMLYQPEPDGPPQGVLKVLLGRRNPETGKVEIIDGRQRTKAAREANRRLKKQGAEPIRLPVLLRRATDVRSMAMLISANEHGTEDSPLNRAKKAQRYIDLGRSEEEVAALLGLSKSSVKNLLGLLDAPAAVRSAVEAGKITLSDGYRLAKLEPGEAREKVAKLVEHAPRTPGKKRSKNAKKAREIVRGDKGAGAGAAGAGSVKEIETATAEAIARWLERNWNGSDWGGSVEELPKRIRAGEWREAAREAAE